jgi:hypothetical protein
MLSRASLASLGAASCHHCSTLVFTSRSMCTAAFSLFGSLVYCAESTVRWFVVREKHCWMAADSADKSKRTGQHRLARVQHRLAHGGGHKCWVSCTLAELPSMVYPRLSLVSSRRKCKAAADTLCIYNILWYKSSLPHAINIHVERLHGF